MTLDMQCSSRNIFVTGFSAHTKERHRWHTGVLEASPPNGCTLHFLLEMSICKMPSNNATLSQECKEACTVEQGVQGGMYRIHEQQMSTLNKNALSKSRVLESRRNDLLGRNSLLDTSFILDLSCGKAGSPMGFNLEQIKKKQLEPL